MPSLHIPSRLRSQLRALAEASEEQIQQLQRSLEALTPDLSPGDVPDRLAVELDTWDDKEKATIAIEGVVGLAAFRAQSGENTEKVVSEVLSAAKRAEADDDEPEEWLTEEQEARLQSGLVKLLSINQLDVAAKAVGVLNDNQRSFIVARVLSEIRPVFQDDVTKGPAAAVVVHSLKVEFMESGRGKEFFVTLDIRDLQSLLKIVQRALAKDQQLQKLLVKLGIPYLEHN